MKIAKYYIMNLPHRQDRRDICIKQLETAGIHEYEFIESIHWKTLDSLYLEDCVNRKYKHRTKDKEAQYGNVGCGHTHLKALEKMLEDFGKDSTIACVMLEDDFEIVNPHTFKNTLHHVINTAPDWDLIHLGGLRNDKEDKREDYLPGIQKVISIWNAHAYVVKNNPTFVEKMKKLADNGYYADRATRKLIRDDRNLNSHKYLITWPYEVQQLRNYSDINRKVR